MTLGSNINKSNILEFCTYILLIALLVVRVFTLPSYNWDFDHEMYYGSRLLHGELLWTHEFHDKLPFVPFLFIIPAYFKSITVFALISLLCIIGSSLYMRDSLRYILKKDDNYTINFVTFLYVALPLFFKDYIYSINCIAVSFYTISFFIIIRTIFYKGYRNYSLYLFLATLCAAIAISIRPYYILSFFITVFLSSYMGAANGQLNKFQKARQAIYVVIIWGFFLALWGIIFNILPYIVTGNIHVFHDGMVLLKSNIVPARIDGHHNRYHGIRSFFSATKPLPDRLFWVFWLFISITIFGKYLLKEYNNNQYLKLYFISFSSALLCLVFMLHEHYWQHYIQLFVGNFCICLFSFVYLHKIDNLFLPRKNTSIILALVVCCVSFGITKNIYEDYKLNHSESYQRKVASEVWQSTTPDWREELFASYLKEHYKHERPDFLFPDDMKAHWILDESRHHFPHASMTMQITSLHWFEKINFRSPFFFIASNLNEYCTLLDQKGPTLVVIAPTSPLSQCFDGTDRFYKEDARLFHGGFGIVVYKRKSSS